MNGDITDLQQGFARHERELGGIATSMKDIEKDIDQMGESQRASETRIKAHVDKRVGDLEARFDRAVVTSRWVIGLAIPTICTLLGLLLGKTG